LPTLILETRISATRQRCFDLARDVSVHCATAAFTQERALPPGVVAGPLNLGDLVIFEARHLGVRQQLHARIVRMEPPHLFADEMIRGAFKSLYHLHELLPDRGDTLMRDTVKWEAPFGRLGKLADVLVLRRHLKRFLERKNSAFKALAEA
jgi:ligand-binding SRPBCC domain-containing protein